MIVILHVIFRNNNGSKRITFHEATHSLGIPEDLPERTEQHTDWIKEMYCDLLPVRGISRMEGITLREREAYLATLFAEGAMDYKSFKDKGERLPYLRSRSMALETCLEKGSVSIEDGYLCWEDPLAMIGNIDALLGELITLKNTGTTQDAEDFLKEHFKPYTYRRIFDNQARLPDYLREPVEQSNPYAASQ